MSSAAQVPCVPAQAALHQQLTIREVCSCSLDAGRAASRAHTLHCDPMFTTRTKAAKAAREMGWAASCDKADKAMKVLCLSLPWPCGREGSGLTAAPHRLAVHVPCRARLGSGNSSTREDLLAGIIGSLDTAGRYHTLPVPASYQRSARRRVSTHCCYR